MKKENDRKNIVLSDETKDIFNERWKEKKKNLK